MHLYWWFVWLPQDIPLEKQRLIFQGKVIKDDKLLKADCGKCVVLSTA